MRLTVLILVALPALSFSQVWEKMISPGIVYRMEVDNRLPRVIHALRFAREAATLQSTTTLAQNRVYGREDDRKGREVLSKIVEQNEAIAGVNGDFFPWTGDPLGAMVQDGEIVSKPYEGRSVFAWGKGYSSVSRLTWSASASFTGKESIKIDGLNESCSKDMVVLNTHAAGNALADSTSFHAVLELNEPLTPTGEWTAKVITTVQNDPRVPIGKNQAVLTATGKAIENFQFLAKGEMVKIAMKTTGLDWQKAKNVVGGGPVIVSGTKPLQAWDAENFNDDFAAKRHPRTAIGFTKTGDIWLVVVEGRQVLSVGATIDETSQIMARLGCVDAMNLDGGGSSEIALFGMIVNRPSDGTERPIANSILIFGNQKKEESDMEYVIQGKPRLSVGSATDYRIVDNKGRIVPQSNVFWSAQGDAWIDQGGRLRSIQAGKATVSAWINGKVQSLEIKIEAASNSSK